MAIRPKRRRNYKAEYKRRVAKGERAGKTRQQARGHKGKEHVERAERSRSKYGASPGTMTRLRREAREKLLAVYNRTARGKVREKTVKRAMKYIHADDLRALIDGPDTNIVNMKNELSPLDPETTAADVYHSALAEYFPESIDDLVDLDFNPGWYK